MGKIIISENSIGFSMRDEILIAEAYTENCIRVRTTRNGRFSDESWTLNDPVKTPIIIEEKDGLVTLQTGILKAEISQGWCTYNLVFYKNGHEILRTTEEGDAVRRFSHCEGDLYRARALFAARGDEHFYGLGQEQQDWFDRKNGSYDLIHYNTKSVIPFVYSSLGYGFLWNSPAQGRCELSKNHTLWQSDCAYQTDYLILAGNSPAEVMKLYCDITGYAPKFPDWAAGFWQSRLRYESQEDLLEVAREYKRRGVPLSAIVIDYFHWTEQGEWEFEPTLWHDPKYYYNAGIDGYNLCAGAGNPEGTARLMECLIASYDDENAVKINEDKHKADFGWTDEMIEMKREIDRLAAENPIADIYGGLPKDTADMLGNLVNQPLTGTDWYSGRESMFDAVQIGVDEVNAQI